MFRCWNRWITYILMYMNCNFCRDATWHVRTGVGLWMGVYDNWYFFCVGRCAHRPYILMEYCDFGMGFCCNGFR